jgi:hypothetical protein
MLLAASATDADGREIVEALDAGDAPAGTRIALEDADAPADAPGEITLDDFLAVPITVRDWTVMAEGKTLHAAGNPIATKAVRNGAVH